MLLHASSIHARRKTQLWRPIGSQSAWVFMFMASVVRPDDMAGSCAFYGALGLNRTFGGPAQTFSTFGSPGGACVQKCIFACLYRHLCRYVHGRVHRHVNRHVDRHMSSRVYKHLYRQV